MNRFGGELKQLVHEKGRKASWPAWSPDGDELLYQQLFGNQVQLFKISLHNGKTQKLTRRGHNFHAAWFNLAGLPVSPQPRVLTTIWGETQSQIASLGMNPLKPLWQRCCPNITHLPKWHVFSSLSRGGGLSCSEAHRPGEGVPN